MRIISVMRMLKILQTAADRAVASTIAGVGEMPRDKQSNFHSAEEVLQVQKMMQMSDLPKALHMEKHKHGCAYKESIRFLCGSLELNVRRELEGPEHINSPVQVATPILPCTCGGVRED